MIIVAAACISKDRFASQPFGLRDLMDIEAVLVPGGASRRVTASRT